MRAKHLIEADENEFFAADFLPERKPADLYRTDPKGACELALKMTKNLRGEERMEAINKLLGMYGVEAMQGVWQNGYWGNTVGTFCNTGDSYATTVLRVRTGWGDDVKLIISSWGDFVESHPEEFEEQPDEEEETRYDYRNIRNESWVSDLYDARPESGFPDIDPKSMSADEVEKLACYLEFDDGTLSEEDMDFSRKVAGQVRGLID